MIAQDAQPLSSSAFSRSFKLLALLIVAACGSWMYQLWSTGKLAANPAVSVSNGIIWLLCGLSLMAYTVVAIYRSQTTLTHRQLKQTWIWNKEVQLDHIAYAKLIRIKGLDWLIAPRLYVRTITGKFTVFYAADTRLVEALNELALRMQRRI